MRIADSIHMVNGIMVYSTAHESIYKYDIIKIYDRATVRRIHNTYFVEIGRNTRTETCKFALKFRTHLLFLCESIAFHCFRLSIVIWRFDHIVKYKRLEYIMLQRRCRSLYSM